MMPTLLHPLRGFFGLASSQGEEHVVEVRHVHGQLLGLDARRVQAVEHRSQGMHSAVARDLEGERLIVAC
jgi:hypothetical protein